MSENILGYFVSSFIALVVLINPISTIGVFLTLTKKWSKEKQYRTAFLASLTAFCILFFFAITGFWIFKIYSITIDAFRIAGGIALLIIGMNMLFPKDNEQKHEADFEQIYIVPLAIPLASGPGAITATIVLAGQVPSIIHEFAFWAAIFCACVLNYVALRFSHKIDRFLGNDGLLAMLKIMGLLVSSIGVQFILEGLKQVFPILG